MAAGHTWSQLVNKCSLVTGGHIGLTLFSGMATIKEILAVTETQTDARRLLYRFPFMKREFLREQLRRAWACAQLMWAESGGPHVSIQCGIKWHNYDHLNDEWDCSHDAEMPISFVHFLPNYQHLHKWHAQIFLGFFHKCKCGWWYKFWKNISSWII